MKHDLTRIFYGKACLSFFPRFFLVGIFISLQLTVMAQQRTVSGTITGTDNTPLPGVSVIARGTTVGTLTGNDGKYTLSVPATSKILVFSFIGMETQEVAITGETVYLSLIHISEPTRLGMIS